MPSRLHLRSFAESPDWRFLSIKACTRVRQGCYVHNMPIGRTPCFAGA